VPACGFFNGRVVVLVTSNGEAIRVALLEALAAGYAVISLRVAGLPKVVDDPENGILLDEVTVEGVATTLERLLADDAIVARFGNGISPRVGLCMSRI